MPQRFLHEGLNLAPNPVPEMVITSDKEHATSLEGQSESPETMKEWKMYTTLCLQESLQSQSTSEAILIQSASHTDATDILTYLITAQGKQIGLGKTL